MLYVTFACEDCKDFSAHKRSIEQRITMIRETFARITFLSFEDEAEMDDWKDIFARLDPKDGIKDGRICKVAYLEWIDMLNFQDTVMLEVNQGISRLELVCIVFLSRL